MQGETFLSTVIPNVSTLSNKRWFAFLTVGHGRMSLGARLQQHTVVLLGDASVDGLRASSNRVYKISVAIKVFHLLIFEMVWVMQGGVHFISTNTGFHWTLRCVFLLFATCYAARKTKLRIVFFIPLRSRCGRPNTLREAHRTFFIAGAAACEITAYLDKNIKKDA